MKQINLQNILIVTLIGLFVWQFFYTKEENSDPQPIQVIIPESSGSTGIQTIESVKTVPVYVPGQGQVIVDESFKRLYEEAKDSLERTNLYLNAIRINTFDTTAINNDTIKLDLYTKTRGSLLEYKIDYKIKEKVFEYKPETIVRRPRFSLSVEAEAGIPTIPNSGFLMKGGLGLENRRGESLLVGYDTENRVWVGLKKSFTVIK